MTILSALAEVAAVTAFLVIVLAASYVLAQRTGLNARWVRHTQPDLTVRRPSESPTELYLRRQREQATAWQEVDR
jgi:hypothetical protein